eukprot:scaffold55054_cov61-Phaeocystis_antarctica.AAC.2
MTESFLAGRERVATMASRRSSASRRRVVPVLGRERLHYGKGHDGKGHYGNGLGDCVLLRFSFKKSPLAFFVRKKANAKRKGCIKEPRFRALAFFERKKANAKRKGCIKEPPLLLLGDSPLRASPLRAYGELTRRPSRMHERVFC